METKISKLRNGDEWIDVSVKVPKGKIFKFIFDNGAVLENITRYRLSNYTPGTVEVLFGKHINDTIYNERFDDFFMLPFDIHKKIVIKLVDSKGKEKPYTEVKLNDWGFDVSVALLYFNQKK